MMNINNQKTIVSALKTLPFVYCDSTWLLCHLLFLSVWISLFRSLWHCMLGAVVALVV